jgi:precorrin-3B synthase
METGDGWLLRIRVPGGVVTTRQIDTVAEVADRFGSGLIDVTSKANLQIRGVAVEHLDDAARSLVGVGLANSDARRDALRAIVGSPLTGHDPTALVDTGPVVDEIERRLVRDLAGSVPSKFNVVVDDGGSWPLDGIDADIRVRADDATWSVSVRGAHRPIGDVTDPVGVVLRAAQWCADHAARLDQLVVSTSPDDLAALLGVHRRAAAAIDRRPPTGRVVGLIRHPDPQRCNVVAAPFLGRLDPEGMRALGRSAADHAASVRFTPDHSIALCGLRRGHGEAVVAELRDQGLTVDAADRRSLISACAGSQGCASAHADTWAEAERRAAASDGWGRVHLSGCAKCCGAPAGVVHLVADEAGAFR